MPAIFDPRIRISGVARQGFQPSQRIDRKRPVTERTQQASHSFVGLGGSDDGLTGCSFDGLSVAAIERAGLPL
jgi:hypothetical protein